MTSDFFTFTRFEIFTAVKIQVQVFWFVTPSGIVGGYRCFGGPCCLHLQGEDGFGFLPATRQFVFNFTISLHHFTPFCAVTDRVTRKRTPGVLGSVTVPLRNGEVEPCYTPQGLLMTDVADNLHYVTLPVGF
jgi:hypothetical protein